MVRGADVIQALSLADTFHDFLSPLGAQGIRDLMKNEIEKVVSMDDNLKGIFSAPSSIENNFEGWLVKQKALRSAVQNATVHKYDAVLRSNTTWKFYNDQVINLGRTYPATLFFKESNQTLLQQNFNELVEKLSGLTNVRYIIDRTLVPEKHYCGPRSRILWGNASSYDQLQRGTDKANILGAGCLEIKSDPVVLTKADGALFELDRVIGKGNALYYNRPGIEMLQTIDLEYLISNKMTASIGLTLFKQGIHLALGVGKRAKTANIGMTGGANKRRFEEIIEKGAYQVLHEGFSLAPPTHRSDQTAYIRALFDFKRIMDMLQVKMAQIMDAIFVTHDRMACMFARMLEVPVLFQKRLGVDLDGRDRDMEIGHDKGVIFFPSKAVVLDESEYRKLVENYVKRYLEPLQLWQDVNVSVIRPRFDMLLDDFKRLESSKSLIKSGMGAKDIETYIKKWKIVYEWWKLAYVTYLQYAYNDIIQEANKSGSILEQYKRWQGILSKHRIVEHLKLDTSLREPIQVVELNDDDFIRLKTIEAIVVAMGANARSINPRSHATIFESLRQLQHSRNKHVSDALFWMQSMSVDMDMGYKKWRDALRKQSGGGVALASIEFGQTTGYSARPSGRPLAVQPTVMRASRIASNLVPRATLVAHNITSKRPLAPTPTPMSVITMPLPHPKSRTTVWAANPAGWFALPRSKWADQARTPFDRVIAQWRRYEDPDTIYIPKHLFFAIQFILLMFPEAA